MKRFNLVLVTKEGELRAAALQALSKVHKSNFVFELPSLEEATNILGKLHIDILMLDLDIAKYNLVELSARYPNVMVMGVAANASNVHAHIDLQQHKVFDKRDFGAALAAELKTQRKAFYASDRAHGRLRDQTPAAATDFRDFFKLNKVSMT